MRVQLVPGHGDGRVAYGDAAVAVRVACVRGLITHKVYDFGMVADDWSRREIFRASLDLAGSVRFERVTS